MFWRSITKIWSPLAKTLNSSSQPQQHCLDHPAVEHLKQLLTLRQARSALKAVSNQNFPEAFLRYTQQGGKANYFLQRKDIRLVNPTQEAATAAHEAREQH